MIVKWRIPTVMELSTIAGVPRNRNDFINGFVWTKTIFETGDHSPCIYWMGLIGREITDEIQYSISMATSKHNTIGVYASKDKLYWCNLVKYKSYEKVVSIYTTIRLERRIICTSNRIKLT